MTRTFEVKSLDQLAVLVDHLALDAKAQRLPLPILSVVNLKKGYRLMVSQARGE